ncbi:hypothetical protein RHMOL_Rhmol08G0240300 [Rhododendron molle]|uniref:Uncharacterized protein n=1 Tax=Rhododendron molle TaxID=49168 RepID=A0ACC0MS49_RHOML|nr:hypothetical protein RHMOL_Rhmol08G0240300 [Rhododendron molle]
MQATIAVRPNRTHLGMSRLVTTRTTPPSRLTSKPCFNYEKGNNIDNYLAESYENFNLNKFEEMTLNPNEFKKVTKLGYFEFILFYEYPNEDFRCDFERAPILEFAYWRFDDGGDDVSIFDELLDE